MKSFIIIAIFSIFVLGCSSKKVSINDPAFANVPSYYKAELDSLLKISDDSTAQFLAKTYQNLPLSDIVDYSPCFHILNVRSSIESARQLSWVKNIPPDIFEKFVLFPRVNNENLDTARPMFYNEIIPRIDKMSMLDAAMEVNHWCHEHVTYKGSDMRTSSPLATYRNALGRCGEESTFSVFALRSVGIPARQVYTPRWAHSDDNHAWVEFWADGKWYFFGACEPEANPNMGWFTEPAKRAMLVNTFVPGQYEGSERVENKADNYSIINTLNVYAKTKLFKIKVVDQNNNPVEGAVVDFTIYNYAEYYPLSSKKTDASGMADFESGLGTIQITIGKNLMHTSTVVNLANQDSSIIKLTPNSLTNYSTNFIYIPPVAPAPSTVSVANAELNKKRLAHEDSIRHAYELSFPDSIEIAKFAKLNNLAPDRILPIVRNSRGNSKEIMDYLKGLKPDNQNIGISLLEVIAEKDLHDTRADVLFSHLNAAPKFDSTTCDYETYLSYVLNPRVGRELITPFRQFLIQHLAENKLKEPRQIFDWFKNNIRLDSTLNFYRVAISPISVVRAKIGDEYSINLAIIASLRSAGIPSRLSDGDMKPEFFDGGKWVKFTSQSKIDNKTSSKIHLVKTDSNKNLAYYQDFTIAKFEKSRFVSLVYDEFKKLKDFTDTLEISAGYYRLTCGSRSTDGSVSTHHEYFMVNDGETKDLKIFKPNMAGSTNSKSILLKTLIINSSEQSKKELLNGKQDLIVVYFKENNEPSKHLFAEIATNKTAYDTVKTQFAFISELPLQNNSVKSLIKNSIFLTEKDFPSLRGLQSKFEIPLEEKYPIIIKIDKTGKASIISTGYVIGLGNKLFQL